MAYWNLKVRTSLLFIHISREETKRPKIHENQAWGWGEGESGDGRSREVVEKSGYVE